MRIECMRTIEIHTETVQTGIGHSSKGNQLKWLQDGWWYKADGFGFEGLAETVVSALLEHSNIQDFVRYEPVVIRYRDKEFRGCRSRNFRKNTEELVPLERLSRIYTGFGLARELSRISLCRERILYVEELVRNVTGIRDFGEYLTNMLEMDAFFLNEDHHTNNIAVLHDKEEKTWRLCPFFDMGFSLFSDTREVYPLGTGFEKCREKIMAKPFSRDFDEQLDAAEELYGTFLRFDFPRESINKILTESPARMNKGLNRDGQNSFDGERAEGKSSEMMVRECSAEKRFGTVVGKYSSGEIQRVEEVLRYQAGKYQYFFDGSSG